MRHEGAPPQGRMPIFSETTPRRHAVLDTTPLNHTYRLHFLISDSYSIFDTFRLLAYYIHISMIFSESDKEVL